MRENFGKYFFFIYNATRNVFEQRREQVQTRRIEYYGGSFLFIAFYFLSFLSKINFATHPIVAQVHYRACHFERSVYTWHEHGMYALPSRT